jgi:hypothetical protein
MAGEPEEGDEAGDGRQRLVQEERVEAGRLERVRRAWVGRDPVGAVDRDPPWQVGRRAVQLLVEEVAPPADRLHGEEGRGNDVRPGGDRLALVLDPADPDEGPEQQAAEDAEPGVGRQDDRQPVVGVQVPAVDDVVEPAADERRDGDDDHGVDDEPRVETLPGRLPGHDDVDGDQPEGVADPVPVDGDRPELNEDRVRGQEVGHRAASVPLPFLYWPSMSHHRSRPARR